MVKRKIPVRKHKGVKDPEKQAATRFASVKDKINNPPTEKDAEAMPRRVLELKNAMERLKNRVPKKKVKRSEKGLIDTAMFEPKKVRLPGMNRREKPVPIFKQLPGETGKAFMHRITLKCQEVIHESQFEDKFNVEVQRNEETGDIEGVEKQKGGDLEVMKEMKMNKQARRKNKKAVEKKKERLNVFKEKKQAKKTKKVDEFAKYRDVVKFGEIVHEPPKLTVLPRKAEAAETVDRPGKRDLLLKGMLQKGEEQRPVSVFDRKLKSDCGKVAKKKKNEKSFAEKRRLEAQRVLAVQAYRDMKARQNRKSAN